MIQGRTYEERLATAGPALKQVVETFLEADRNNDPTARRFAHMMSRQVLAKIDGKPDPYQDR